MSDPISPAAGRSQSTDTAGIDTVATTKVALVTGAARRIGATISRRLHQRGCRVALHCRHSGDDDAQALVQELNGHRPDSALMVHADLTDQHAAEQLPAQVTAHWQRLDILIHNASSFFPTPIGQTTAAHWDSLLGSNLRGPFFLSQAAAPYLRRTQGAMVTLVDIHAERPLRDHPLYCMAKAGLVMMTRSLAKELAPQVRVNGVAPGYILTPPEGMDDAVEQLILSRTALQRRGEPDDIAGAVCFLALDASYVSGQILAVDGGRSLHL